MTSKLLLFEFCIQAKMHRLLENIFFFLSDLFIARILYALLPKNFSRTIVLGEEQGDLKI